MARPRPHTVYFLAFVLAWGATGIWVGVALGNVAGAVVAALRFGRGTWKRALVDRDTPAAD